MPNKTNGAPCADAPIATPCVKICKLDADNVCVGCDRTLDEIVRWGRMTSAERQTVMERVALPRADAAP